MENRCAGQVGGTESEAEESIGCGGDQGAYLGCQHIVGSVVRSAVLEEGTRRQAPPIEANRTRRKVPLSVSVSRLSGPALKTMVVGPSRVVCAPFAERKKIKICYGRN